MEIRRVFAVPPPRNVPGLLERIVQSNSEKGNLELTVQVIRNPRGRVKRKLQKTLDVELIKKKWAHLHIVSNRGN